IFERAKELFMWTPNCIVEKEVVYSSDNDSVQDADQSQNNDESGDDNGSDIDGMADDKFDGNPVPPLNSTDEHEVQQSKDPFELYDLLKKNKTRKEIRDPSHSLSHLPGFTPLCSQVRMDNDQINRVTDGELAKEASPVISAKVMNMSQHVQEEDLSKSGRIDGATGGSVLGVLEEVIRVGQVMGYSMEGCKKDIESIIGNQGAEGGFR
nr:RNA-directed DNA polymerase, eukaryota [Tanacetum cinerariifolium]